MRVWRDKNRFHWLAYEADYRKKNHEKIKEYRRNSQWRILYGEELGFPIRDLWLVRKEILNKIKKENER